MGLDGVELVMEIEDRFGISIPDDQAVQMRTPGDVFDFILAKTDVETDASVCLLAATFFKLRRSATALGVSDTLRPRSETRDLLPESNQQSFWRKLQSRSGLSLPPLELPSWLEWVIGTITIVAALACGFAIFSSNGSILLAFLASIAGGTCSAMLLAHLTRPFAVFPGDEFSTLRGLTECVLSLNYKSLSTKYQAASQNDLWIVLRGTIAEQLGVDPNHITPTVDFVRDLGLD